MIKYNLFDCPNSGFFGVKLNCKNDYTNSLCNKQHIYITTTQYDNNKQQLEKIPDDSLFSSCLAMHKRLRSLFCTRNCFFYSPNCCFYFRPIIIFDSPNFVALFILKVAAFFDFRLLIDQQRFGPKMIGF